MATAFVDIVKAENLEVQLWIKRFRCEKQLESEAAAKIADGNLFKMASTEYFIQRV